MIVGTAGHIDHGKTTLVKALTGVDCDRLKEEKARGITLDLGYAYRRLSDPGDAEPVLGFIDVPGHEKLVHNMLAGATGIDFALLVIAADDGPMPQTREHLEIIELLGIRRGAVALTKTALVDAERLASATAEIRALLAATPLAASPIFPVDALRGDGIDELRAHLESAARASRAPPDRGHFRLAIDRAFTLSGTGTVVTGTAFSGHVDTGALLTLSPTGGNVRVRSLRVQGETATAGSAGQRIALAIAGVDKQDIERGMWLLAPALHLPRRVFCAALRVLPSQPPFRHWTQVHCHLGADDIPGRVALLSGETLPPGEHGFAEIVLERDTSVLVGDRLVLRDAAARATLAGGTVVDIDPPSRRKRAPERLAQLAALASADPADGLALITGRQAGGIDLARFALSRNLDDRERDALCAALGLHVVAGIAFTQAHWAALGERIVAALADEHLRHPDMPGVERDRLRRIVLPTLARAAFDARLAELLAEARISQTGAWLHLPAHHAQISASDRERWQTLAPMLAEAPFNPPRVRDIAHLRGDSEETIRATMKRFARLGDVYPVAHDHYFLADAVADLARRVAAQCAAHGATRAAVLRDDIGGGRKVAIQILEFFDRIGYTRRVRDTHVLRQTQTGDAARFFRHT